MSSKFDTLVVGDTLKSVTKDGHVVTFEVLNSHAEIHLWLKCINTGDKFNCLASEIDQSIEIVKGDY